MTTAIYPKNLLPISGAYGSGEGGAYELACELVLLNYGYQTARAYLADFECFARWCDVQRPPVAPLDATSCVIWRYLTELRLRGYSPNTVARRLTALRLLFDHRADKKRPNPARLLRVPRRATPPNPA